MEKISLDLGNIIVLTNNKGVPYQASYENARGSYLIIPYFKSNDIANSFRESFEVLDSVISETTMIALLKSVEGTQLIPALFEDHGGTFKVTLQNRIFGSELVN